MISYAKLGIPFRTPASTSAVAMALPCMMLTICIPMLITGIWVHDIRVPFRVSSLPPRAILPPLTYTIVEDVIAVDGGGLLDFRQAWRHRYEESRIVRKLCRDTAIAWGLTGTVLAIGLIFAAWYAPTDTGYGVSYGMPWAWAFAGIPLTVWWSVKQLEIERAEWDQPYVHRERPLKLVEDEDAKAADVRVLARKATFLLERQRSMVSQRQNSSGAPRQSQSRERRQSQSRERRMSVARPSTVLNRSSAPDNV